MRRKATLAILGFLVGAGALAIGQEGDRELAEELARLQEAASRVLHRAQVAQGVPEVDERGHEFSVIPVADLCIGVVDFIPPQHDLRFNEDSETPLFGWETEEAPQFFGTIEEVLELVRVSVWPEAWNDAGSFIVASGPNLHFSNKPPVLRDVRRYLDQSLRARAFTCVTVEAQILECPHELRSVLASGSSPALSDGHMEALDAALQSGAARRLFAQRVTGLANQRVLIWHGRQVSVASDPDVEVAQETSTSDPNANVVQAGGFVSVRPVPGEDLSQILLDVKVLLDRLADPVDRRETRANAVLDMPQVTRTEATASITVPVRTWAVVATSSPEEAVSHVVLVRGTILPREGGGR